MNDNERIKELESQLAAVTAERDQLADKLAAKDNGFDFGRAMARIEAKQRDDAEYQCLMEESFEKGASETTKYI